MSVLSPVQNATFTSLRSTLANYPDGFREREKRERERRRDARCIKTEPPACRKSGLPQVIPLL